MTYPNARDVMEAAASAALARYLEATSQRHDTTAERAYRNHILLAWERTIAGQAAEQAFRNSMTVTHA